VQCLRTVKEIQTVKYYFLNNEDALVRLREFVIINSPISTLPKEATFEGDYAPTESTLRNQFKLVYETLPPTSPFRVVGEDFTFYDCEIVSILPIEHTISGVLGDPQMNGEVQRESLAKMMTAADWAGGLPIPD
jgi:hypothetical protein